MVTKLDRILDEIDPSRTIDVIENRINNALAGYNQKKNTVDSRAEIEPILAEVFRKLENAALKAEGRIDCDIDFDSSRAMSFLERAYESEHTIYKIMLNGVEGGIYTIIKTLTRLMVEKYSNNMINAKLSDWWDTLSNDERLEISEEYLEKFQDILPLSTRKDNIRIKTYFYQVLVDHPWMMKRLRDQG